MHDTAVECLEHVQHQFKIPVNVVLAGLEGDWRCGVTVAPVSDPWLRSFPYFCSWWSCVHVLHHMCASQCWSLRCGAWLQQIWCNCIMRLYMFSYLRPLHVHRFCKILDLGCLANHPSMGQKGSCRFMLLRKNSRDAETHFGFAVFAPEVNKWPNALSYIAQRLCVFWMCFVERVSNNCTKYGKAFADSGRAPEGTRSRVGGYFLLWPLIFCLYVPQQTYVKGFRICTRSDSTEWEGLCQPHSSDRRRKDWKKKAFVMGFWQKHKITWFVNHTQATCDGKFQIKTKQNTFILFMFLTCCRRDSLCTLSLVDIWYVFVFFHAAPPGDSSRWDWCFESVLLMEALATICQCCSLFLRTLKHWTLFWICDAV